MTNHAPGVQPQELSLWFGTALIAIGVTVNLFFARRYMRLFSTLNLGQFVHRSPSKQGLIVALSLALLGIAMSIYMILVLAPLPNVLHA
jgi:putative membrane protein